MSFHRCRALPYTNWTEKHNTETWKTFVTTYNIAAMSSHRCQALPYPTWRENPNTGTWEAYFTICHRHWCCHVFPQRPNFAGGRTTTQGHGKLLLPPTTLPLCLPIDTEHCHISPGGRTTAPGQGSLLLPYTNFNTAPISSLRCRA